MESETSDWVIGLLTTALGLLGLVLASRAHDSEILLFGWSLTLFCALFTFGLIKAHYDEQDARRHQTAKAPDHG